MNTPNPLHPQGAFLDPRGRSHVRIAFFTIVAIHVVLLGALLLQGCKRTKEDDQSAKEPTNLFVPPFEPTTNVFIPTDFPPPRDTVPSPTPVITPPVVITPPISPPPTPPPIVTPPAPEKEHEIVRGDSFYLLAQKYGVTTKAIIEANPGLDPRRLQIGQKIRIPAPVKAAPAAPASPAAVGGELTYEVKSGDTLYRIARKHGTTVNDLRKLNNLRTDRLLVGQKLLIPAKAAPPPRESGTAPRSPGSSPFILPPGGTP